ncbi:hypothetical protein PN502_15355 [Microcystis aeruginosa CS-338/01]|nr:hypothetical protein [Microcystis aeruginosa]MDB9508417.1 hypothetical protein [Microcystis aeruginosa CS-338/01]
MTAVTENDLKRLEDLIVSGQKAIESRLTNLENGEKAIEKPAILILKRFCVVSAI